MLGPIDYWNKITHQGIVAVTENGTVRRYFLLRSRILEAPEFVEAGDTAEFVGATPPKHAGLLPVATGVRIYKKPAATSDNGGSR